MCEGFAATSQRKVDQGRSTNGQQQYIYWMSSNLQFPDGLPLDLTIVGLKTAMIQLQTQPAVRVNFKDVQQTF